MYRFCGEWHSAPSRPRCSLLKSLIMPNTAQSPSSIALAQVKRVA